MREPGAKTLLACFLRSYMVGAAYNPRGLQNIGFMYALEPVLATIYGPGPALAAARTRYVNSYNCHPFFTPMLLGVFAHMETLIARGALDKGVLENIKDATANSLSAIGDSFFNGTMLSTWALSCACFILAGMPGIAVTMTATGFVLLQLFKAGGFVLGLKKGMAVLFFLRRLDLINQGDIFKCVNAVLLVLFLWLAAPAAGVPAFAAIGVYLLLAAWLVGRRHLARVVVALALLALIVGLHVSGLFGSIPVFLH